jgi:hypothetical protein
VRSKGAIPSETWERGFFNVIVTAQENSDVHDSQIRGGPLGVLGGDASSTYEMGHGMLDPMTQLVEISVIIALIDAMLSGRHHWAHAPSRGLFQDGVGVVAPGWSDF